MTRKTLITLIPGVLLASFCLGGTAAASDWRRVGWFRSDTRNVSVGDTVVRVVSGVDIARLGLTGEPVDDSELVNRYYPGWDYMSDLVVYYTAGPNGFRQSSFEYKSGTERVPLPTDTIASSLGVFDHAGTRKVDVPGPLKKTLGDTVLVVASCACRCDTDADPEWLVVTSGKRDPRTKAAPQSLRLYDLEGGRWTAIMTQEIRDSVRTGPLEQRDVTGDGNPDFVYRCFLETSGHFWVDVHVFSNQDGFASVLLPALFDPGLATGPVR